MSKFTTYVEIRGEQFDDVECEYESSPAEPDVNWAGSMDIISVMHNGEELVNRIGGKDLDGLIDRATEHENESALDRIEAAADHAYEQEKDRRMGL